MPTPILRSSYDSWPTIERLSTTSTSPILAGTQTTREQCRWVPCHIYERCERLRSRLSGAGPRLRHPSQHRRIDSSMKLLRILLGISFGGLLTPQTRKYGGLRSMASNGNPIWFCCSPTKMMCIGMGRLNTQVCTNHVTKLKVLSRSGTWSTRFPPTGSMTAPSVDSWRGRLEVAGPPFIPDRVPSNVSTPCFSTIRQSGWTMQLAEPVVP